MMNFKIGKHRQLTNIETERKENLYIQKWKTPVVKHKH